jgi:type VI secretion system protein ImpM
VSAEALNSQEPPGGPGFYGKLPIRGDFLSRRLPLAYTQAWDVWMQESIASSRERLHDRWLDCYLTSPVWRYLINDARLGEGAFAGVLIPSVDQVGRYFPFLISAQVHHRENLFHLLVRGTSWFDAAELTALEALNQNVDIDELDNRIRDLGYPDFDHDWTPLELGQSTSLPWRLPLRATDRIGELMPAVAEHLFRERFSDFSLWWTNGSRQVEPTLVVYSGLPPTTDFASLMTGEWEPVRGDAE